VFGRAAITLGIGPHSSSFFFFSLPSLSGRRLDVYHTSTHDVALVQIQNACLKYAERGSVKIQNSKITPKSPSTHHRTTLSSCIFATKACIDNRQKLLNGNISICPQNMLNFSPLTAEICWRVWGTPANFNGCRVLAPLPNSPNSPNSPTPACLHRQYWHE